MAEQRVWGVPRGLRRSLMGLMNAWQRIVGRPRSQFPPCIYVPSDCYEMGGGGGEDSPGSQMHHLARQSPFRCKPSFHLRPLLEERNIVSYRVLARPGSMGSHRSPARTVPRSKSPDHQLGSRGATLLTSKRISHLSPISITLILPFHMNCSISQSAALYPEAAVRGGTW